MKFKFKGHIGKSAFFPLPPFVLRLFVYIDCWNFMAINTIIIIIIIYKIYPCLYDAHTDKAMSKTR